MRAMRLVEVNKPLKMMDVEIPKVKGNEVLVKVEAAGVCHSDVHMRQGRVGPLRIVEDLRLRLPITLGHEIAGRVVEVGENVEGFNKGDLVAVNPWEGDGTCYYCKAGEEQMCDRPLWLGISIDGGYAEYVKVTHYKYLYKLKNLTAVEAAPLTCSGITTYRAVREASVDPSKTLVIVGAGGGLGTMAVQIAKAMTGATVIGVDIRDEALEAAKRAGADYVVDGRKNPVQEIRTLTGGKGADAIIDLNNSEKTLSVYPYALAKNGRYVMIGLYGGELKILSPIIIFNWVKFVGSQVGNNMDFLGVLTLAERGKIKPMVTKMMKLEEANEALDNLENARVTGRQVLVP
ncbi:NAD(P)-dependent alcohol dehydrogenase [Sulfolobus sp. S-194]|uniref:NAD(P)-dependent alcohol dehydrogenase n=1 Tax=Sulfolobus sp. S-194 TaxID=2512240 RepID=UPI0014372524|nr:NAD(P)-dependent alcohol dehydrogenase [Sulfolobus sp. S-194]QIW22909.1 NAD(P)-dependent alcohol dehydrogenase [Sulfolobus sp. S-194]